MLLSWKNSLKLRHLRLVVIAGEAIHSESADILEVFLLKSNRQSQIITTYGRLKHSIVVASANISNEDLIKGAVVGVPPGVSIIYFRPFFLLNA